jgi:quinol monooxygenase YgiN
MIVIAGTITFASGHRDGAVAAGRTFQAATRAEEPGCLAYSFAPDPVDENVIVVYELWADAESLAAHFLHPNYFAMRDALGRFERTGFAVSKYRIDAVAPVYGPDRVATTSFEV